MPPGNWHTRAVRPLRARLPLAALLTASLAALLAAGACTNRDAPEAQLDRLRQPTGMAQSPDGNWLVVTNGNWDRGEASSTVVFIDLRRLEEGIDNPRDAAASLTAARPCRETGESGRVECDDRALIDAAASLRLPSGAGNVGVDQPAGEMGLVRLLIPSRLEPVMTWIDVDQTDADELVLDCGQDETRTCDGQHRFALADDPSRVFVDTEYRFAYLPHLLEPDAEDCEDQSLFECGGLTLISLDGQFGPETSDIGRDVFQQLEGESLRGGFAAARRACDVGSGNAPTTSLGCARPYFYVTNRFWPGLRKFRVLPGFNSLIAGGTRAILGVNPELNDGRPLAGDLEFEDPSTGNRLLMVHTTPPGLARIDTSLDEAGNPRDELLQSTPLCRNPNILEVYHPADGGEALAFVSCYSSDVVDVVGLSTFSRIASLELGEGPNELVIDVDRKRLLVANTLEDSISVVSLDRTKFTFLSEIATVGLGVEREDD